RSSERFANPLGFRGKVFFATGNDSRALRTQELVGHETEIVVRCARFAIAVIKPDWLGRIGRSFEDNARDRIITAEFAQFDRGVVPVIGFEKERVALRLRVELNYKLARCFRLHLVLRGVGERAWKFVAGLVSYFFPYPYLAVVKRCSSWSDNRRDRIWGC